MVGYASSFLLIGTNYLLPPYTTIPLTVSLFYLEKYGTLGTHHTIPYWGCMGRMFRICCRGAAVLAPLKCIYSSCYKTFHAWFHGHLGHGVIDYMVSIWSLVWSLVDFWMQTRKWKVYSTYDHSHVSLIILSAKQNHDPIDWIFILLVGV